MANIVVTYSFTNGTTIDGPQFNQNFTDIVNGTKDGTKDFSIAALSCTTISATAITGTSLAVNGIATIGSSAEAHVVNGTISQTASSGTLFHSLLYAGSGDVYIRTGNTGGDSWGFGMAGSGKAFALRYSASGSAAPGVGSLYFQINTSGSIILNSAALATNAGDGFLYIASCAGTPTGTPSTNTGRVAMVYDTTNNKFYIFNSTWKAVTLA